MGSFPRKNLGMIRGTNMGHATWVHLCPSRPVITWDLGQADSTIRWSYAWWTHRLSIPNKAHQMNRWCRWLAAWGPPIREGQTVWRPRGRVSWRGGCFLSILGCAQRMFTFCPCPIEGIQGIQKIQGPSRRTQIACCLRFEVSLSLCSLTCGLQPLGLFWGLDFDPACLPQYAHFDQEQPDNSLFRCVCVFAFFFINVSLSLFVRMCLRKQMSVYIFNDVICRPLLRRVRGRIDWIYLLGHLISPWKFWQNMRYPYQSFYGLDGMAKQAIYRASHEPMNQPPRLPYGFLQAACSVQKWQQIHSLEWWRSILYRVFGLIHVVTFRY